MASYLSTALLILTAVGFSVSQSPDLTATFEYMLNNDDLNAIKSSIVCTRSGTCFLATMPGSFADALGLTSIENIVKVTNFKIDETNPTLIQFKSFFLTDGTIVLDYDEVIDLESVNFTGVRLQSSFDDSGDTISLRPGEVVNIADEFSTEVVLRINVDDLNIIKRDGSICTARGICWIRYPRSFLRDARGNQVRQVADGSINTIERAFEVVPDRDPPNLVNFSVVVDESRISLTFDETVSTAQLDFTKITFTSRPDNSAINYTLTDGALLSFVPSDVVEFTLDPDDVLQLKAIDNLFSSMDDTFIIFPESLIEDQFTNNVVARVINQSALQVANFTNDTVPVVVERFDIIDLDNNFIRISFNEPVDISSIVIESFAIASSPDRSDSSAVLYNLTGSSAVTYFTANKLTIEITFSDIDIRAIKLEPRLASNRSTTYLDVYQNAINDVSGNPNIALANRLMVIQHIPDSRGPMLLSYILNLTSNTIEFAFDDTVRIRSLDPTRITLQSESDGGLLYTLTGGNSPSSDDFNFTLQLSEEDTNAIKSMPRLATNVSNTYLSLTAETLIDVFSARVFPVVQSDARQASQVVPDSINPQLSSFSLNYNSELLTLNFSEIVQVSRFDVAQVTIQNTAVFMPGVTSSLTLTGGIIASDPYVTTFAVELTREDLNYLKADTSIAVGYTSTYLVITSDAIVDSNYNGLVEIPPTSALNVTSFTADETPPVLTAFDLDMNIGQITFTFDEVVNGTSFNPVGVQIQNSYIPTTYYRLTDGTVSRQNQPVITVNFTDDNLNSIKRDFNLATSKDTTFVTLSEIAVADMNRVNFSNISIVQVTTFTNDSTRPELVFFTLDLNLGFLNLTFSETVDSTSLMVQYITLLADNGTDDTSLMHTLYNIPAPDGSATISDNSTRIDIKLGINDLNEIKRLINLGNTIDNTYIAFTSELIVDMNGNQVEEITPDDPAQVLNITDDTTLPELVEFSLDMNVGCLNLTFTETVNASSLNITSIVFQNGNNTFSNTSHSLKSSITNQNDSVILVVKLSDEDLNLLKFENTLASFPNNTYLRLLSDALVDMSNNAHVESSESFLVSTFIPDTTPPSLDMFSLDINTGVLSLTFTEVINGSSLNLTLILLQSDTMMMPDSQFLLTGGEKSGTNFDSGHPPVIDSALTTDDLNRIKQLDQLAISNETTYISINDNAAFDLSPNLNALLPVQTQRVDQYYMDITDPKLLEFHIDLTKEILTLVFDETVEITSLNIPQITLQSSNLNTSVSMYDLYDSALITTQDDTVLQISLSTMDLNTVKLDPYLCTRQTNCYISLTEDAIQDMNMNSIQEISSNNATKVANFTEDLVPPELDDFDLDMNEGLITLIFTEPVNVSTLQIEQFTLHAMVGDNTSDTTEQLIAGMLPEQSSTNSSNGVEVVITLGTANLFSIQRKLLLAISEETTHISINTDAVRDMNNLSIVTIFPNMSQQVRDYTMDSTAPELLEYLLDVDQGLLSLTFDETVDASEIMLGNFMILPTNDTMAIPELPPLSSSTIQPLFDDPIINITLGDLNDLKLQTDLGTDEENTYLYILAGAVTDTSGNDNRIFETVQQATLVIDDTTPPEAIGFEVNLNYGYIIISFNEPVNAASINYTSFTLQNHEENFTTNYTLTFGSNPGINGMSIMINFTDDDINTIKQMTDLFVSQETSFLSFTSDAIVDMADNPVSPRPNSNALPATIFINDTTSPVLIQFNLDMDLGRISLIFTETVNASSAQIDVIMLQKNEEVIPFDNSHTLTGGNLLSNISDTRIEIELTPEDQNELKRLEIGLTQETTYIVLPSNFISDKNGNPVRPVNNDSAKEVTMYMRDVTPPELESFTLDLTMEILSLTFSETVRSSTLDVSAFTLQDMTNSTSFSLTPLSSNTDSDNGVIIEVILGPADLNQIKMNTNLATSIDNTYLSITSAAVRDMSGVPVQNDSLMSMRADNFTEDTVNPQLNNFILDLDSGDLILLFSETVNGTSLNITTFSLQNSQNMSDMTSSVLLSSVRVYDIGSIITATLLTVDLNEIKRLLDLGNDRDNTYITVFSGGVNDMNNNPVDAITQDMALQAMRVVPDEVPPELEGFSLNLNNSQLTLTFSETVSVPSLSLPGIILQNAEDSIISYALTDTSRVQIENSSELIIFLSALDANAIKEQYTLAIDNTTTYLRLQANSIQDMNENYIEEIPDGNATAVDEFTPDFIDPLLLQFDLDMDEGILLLTFDEPVNIDTFNFASLTIVNSSSSDEMYVLTGGYPSMRNYTEVNITLTQFDLNNIKVLLSLATDDNDTYISFESSFVRDMNGNFIDTNRSIILATNFIPDETSPMLISFGLDLTNNILTLNFSEAVSAMTLQPSAVTLQATRQGGPSHTISSSYVSPDVDSTSITVHLSTEDVNEITRLPFATGLEDTYISIYSTAINDTNMNMVEQIPDNDALNVSQYIEDNVEPSLDRFDLNVSSGVIVLYFSETVNASTLDVTGFALQNDNDTVSVSPGYYRLTNVSSSSPENYYSLQIFIGDDDLNVIKADYSLAIGNDSTYISVDNASVLDMAGNPLTLITSSMAIPVRIFTEDFIMPVLGAFNLRFRGTQLVLELIFSETVNAMTVDPTKFIFSNAENVSNVNYTVRLTGGNVSMDNSTFVTINITAEDLDTIRELDFVSLLTTPNTSYLAIDPNATEDMVGNTIVPVPIEDGQKISGPFADLQPPRLISAIFDLNLGALTLMFDEPVINFSLNATELTLQSARNFTEFIDESYTLTSYESIISGSSDDIVILTITLSDLNVIKRLTRLGVSEDTTYVSFSRGLVVDYALNEAILIPTTDALRASAFIQDTTGPLLVEFNISMTEQIINLTFSETINSSSVDVTKFIFLNEMRAAISSYTLSDSNVISNDSTLLTISFSFSDINNIKAIEDLLTSRDDTFIAVDREGLMDMAGNELIEVFPFNAEQVTAFLPDMINPELVNYTIDIDQGDLLLTFTETVQERSLDITQLTFQSNFSIPDSRYNLTAAISNSNNSHVLSITISLFDLNNIKALTHLCTSPDNCYLSFSTDLVMDMVGLPVVEVPSTDAAEGVYVPDTTGPMLLHFVQLDYASNNLVLEMSETVNVSTINFIALTLQSLFTDPILPTVTLTGGQVPPVNMPLLVITLIDNDLDALQNTQYTCSNRGNCYVRFTSNFVQDMSGNPAQAIGDDFPGFLVQEIIEDNQSPMLLYFDLDMEEETLTLNFNEAIDVGEVDLTQITLQGNQNASREMQFPLTGGTIRELDPRTILIDLDPADVDNLKSSIYIKNETSTFLSLTRFAVRDLAFIPNFVTEIPPYNAINVRNFTEDTDGPILLSFVLDYDSNQLILNFNEPVLAESLNFTGVIIHSDPLGGYNYSLTGGEISNAEESGDGLVQLIIDLSEADAIELQSSDLITSNRNNTFLTLNNNTITDGSDDPNLNITLQGDITLDNTPAQLESFTFDESLGLLNLTFSDVVSASSLYPLGITIQNARTSDPSLQYTLTEGSFTNDANGFTISVQLSDNDLNAIKSNPLLATEQSNTFMTTRASTIDDVFGNDILAVTNGKAIMASGFIADDTIPYLEMFNLDLDEGYIVLNFSETIDSNTLDPSKFRIQGDDSDTGEALTLDINSTAIPVTPYQIIIQLTDNDFNRLKRLETVGTTQNDTYIAVLQDAGTDYSNNTINASTIQVNQVLPDVTSPELHSFDLNFNTGYLFLTFSETVNASSLDVTQLLFQGVEIYRTGQRYSLTTSIVNLVNAPNITVTISRDDLNVLKQLTSVATNADDTYLSISGSTILDMSANPVVAIPDIGALRVNEYINDTNNPSLEKFNLNLTTDELILFFDETVETSTIDVTQITLHNSVNQNASRTLTGGIVNHDDSPTVTIALADADLNFIKQDDSFATTQNNTYLTLTSFTVEDTALKPNQVNPVTTALMVTEIYNDSVSPRLVSFEFDAHLGIIVLTFSETVRTNTLNSTFITLQNDRSNFIEYRLTGGYSNSSDDNIIVVQLNDVDQNAIKSLENFVTDTSNTFIRITPDGIMDMNSNPVTNIVPSEAIQASNYTSDMIRPELISFYLNLNTSQLFLTFSETVDASTVQFSNWTIQNAENHSTEQVHLLAGSVSTEDATHIIITLSRSDINRLKVIEDLAIDNETTYISITEGAVLDTFGNSVEPIPDTQALRASMVIPDEMPPILYSFTLDMNNGWLHFSFDEVVRVETTNFTAITLQNTANTTTLYTLTNGSVISNNSDVIIIQLSDEDTNNIKRILNLATTRDDSYLSINTT